MSLKSVVESMIADGGFRRVLMNPVRQFGRPRREYLGARFLPERLVPNNEYTETNIKYRTIVANDGSRYSPAQKKGNDIVGTMRVSLGNQDIASEFTSEDYDAHIAVAKLNAMSENTGNPAMVEMTNMADWFDQHINMGLLDKIEKMRWEGIVDASIPLAGDNGYAETVSVPNPAGHRVGATQDFTDPTDDPLQDIYDMLDLAADEGYTLGALVAGRPVISALLRHPKVVAAVGGYINVSGGALVGNTRRVTLEDLNTFLGQDDIPPIISYNLQYRTQLASAYFLKRDVIVGLALTGRDMTIDLGDNEYLPMRDTLGYVGVGRAAGQAGSGRAASVEVFGNKPPRAEFEGWQTSFPIVTDPNAVFVINSITTS